MNKFAFELCAVLDHSRSPFGSGMEGDVQLASLAARTFDAHVLATMPREASARTGGDSAGTVPRTGSSSAMFANARFVAGGRSQPPAEVVRYLLKQEVVTTVGIALRANHGSIVTQQLISNVLSVVEQLQSYAQVSARTGHCFPSQSRCAQSRWAQS